MRSYRTMLNAIGRKPINPDKLRTVKRAGDVEIVYDPRVGGYVGHRHEGVMSE